jgi:hypothetical protein
MNWFCLYITIAGEFRTLSDLQARQLNAYLPLETRIRTTRGQRREYQTPLLPRYLFLCLADIDQLWQARSLATVQEVLPHEHEPLAISGYVVDSFKQREAAGEFRFRETITGRRRQRKILRSFEDLVILRKTAYVVAS